MQKMTGTARATKRYKAVSDEKGDGVTYTPTELANFVAWKIVAAGLPSRSGQLRILDPAAGHGELLLALLEAIGGDAVVCGYETDPAALATARKRISSAFPNAQLNLTHGDFLDHVLDDFGGGLFGTAEPYDVIIANPPYVRTQIMGADRAQQLANQFGLGGRVDLYQAFLLGMAKVLAPDGAAGFIVSNRFMTTRGGASSRTAMLRDLSLTHVYDLGDTKLFDAAVLPAVLIARGVSHGRTIPYFSSIYETGAETTSTVEHVLDALESEGCVGLHDGRVFAVQHGVLDYGDDPASTWRLASQSVDHWLATVASRAWGTFSDIGKIRVGVKTCADTVFLPKKWEEELELLRPLTTHHTARRFRPLSPNRQILYPHETVNGRKAAVDINLYPKTRAYLEKYRDRLSSRQYVLDAGRNWYEIWVPQNPAKWALPKLVFRDISEQPTFWMDMEGTVVNGDCYWLSGKEDLLWLALAVGNSTFIERFYDRRFNNKLYSGRRRFITQYVEKFPLPEPKEPLSQQIIAICKRYFSELASGPSPETETQLDQMVWAAFGLPVEKV